MAMRWLQSTFIRGMAVATLAAAAFAASPKAEATPLNFDLSGTFSAHWTFDSNPTPLGFSFGDDYTYFTSANVTGLAPGLKLVFYGPSLGGFRLGTQPDPADDTGVVYDIANNLTPITSVFSGPVTAPTFAPGVFVFDFDYHTGTTVVATLTVTDPAIVAATPLPASLPLLVTAMAGMGFVGWRRHKARAEV
jgi:hypothetical protein